MIIMLRVTEHKNNTKYLSRLCKSWKKLPKHCLAFNLISKYFLQIFKKIILKDGFLYSAVYFTSLKGYLELFF